MIYGERIHNVLISKRHEKITFFIGSHEKQTN